MVTRIFTLFVFSLLLASILVSCDEHDYIDNTIRVGSVLCDDHQVLSLEGYKAQNKAKAVGVVYATQTDEHPAIVVLLNEIKKVQFCDSLGMKQGTSCSLTAYDGSLNTVSLQNNIDAQSKHGSPMASAVFRYGAFGQSAFIPSLQEMRLLASSLDIVNPVISELGGTPISTVSTEGSCWYWSSTEVKENSGKQAWLVSAAGGSYQETPKIESHSVRPIIYLYN